VELPLGELCATCRSEIERRVRKIARWIALGTTVVLAAYIVVRVPPDPTARSVGAIAILVWYLLTGAVARRILRETLN
jgi:hypothetical protein